MTRLALVLSLISLLTLPAAARAQQSEDAPTGWELTLVPYLWGTAIEGNVEAQGVSADIDVELSEIFDHLDMGMLVAFEARRGKLSLSSDLIYIKLSGDGSKPLSPLLPPAPVRSFGVDVEMQSLVFEGRAAYEVLSVPLAGGAADDAEERSLALDLGPGLRAWWLYQEVDVTLRPGVPFGPFSRGFDETIRWIDLVASARLRLRLGDTLGLVVSGDYGGFDIGSSAHCTWSLAAFAQYRLGPRWALEAGWRKIEIERGPVDLELTGPLLGASYRF